MPPRSPVAGREAGTPPRRRCALARIRHGRLSHRDWCGSVSVGRRIHCDLWLAGFGLGHEQLRVLEVDRRQFAARNNHACTQLGRRPQLLREVLGHANAAVGGRIARQHAFVQRHPGPGDALHEWHRRIAVQIGAVVAVLLDDAEDAHRSRMSGHAGRDRPLRDPHAVAEKRHPLVIDRDDDLQRTLRHFAEAHFFFRLGPFPPRRRGAQPSTGDRCRIAVIAIPAVGTEEAPTRSGVRRDPEADEQGRSGARDQCTMQRSATANIRWEGERPREFRQSVFSWDFLDLFALSGSPGLLMASPR